MGRWKAKDKVTDVSQNLEESNPEGRISLLKPVPKIKKSSPDQSVLKANTSRETLAEEKITDAKNNEDEKHKGKGVSIKNENETKQSDHKDKEKLSGLIFLCSAKTKADCFRYMVMGFPEGRKELVLNIRPGLKLFLFDYNAKFLHGIYKASSPGGLRLEPAAFNGSFIAQVRFEVDQDCSPLPPNVFSNAIKENFDARKNLLLRNDLTKEQVSRLVDLFRRHPVRPVHQHQTVFQSLPPVSIAIPPMSTLPPGGISHLHQSAVARAQRTQQMLKETPREIASRVISEKDYRTYGLLQRPSVHTSAPLPTTKPPAPLLNAGNTRQETYHPYRYSATSSYAAAQKSLDHHHVGEVPRVPSEMAYGPRGVSTAKYKMDIAERLSSSTHAGNALAVYNRSLQESSTNADLASLPVSSRYSFAGPTLSYR